VGFDLLIVDKRPNMVVLKALGKGCFKYFENEGGLHQVQRVPPTEKRGRTHTSLISVAILPIPKQTELEINPQDLDVKTCRGSGAGGQHRNTTDSAVQITHTPSGIMVRCESERSQHQNKETALSILRAKLLKEQRQKEFETYNKIRRDQVSSTSRGAGKKRTVRFQDDLVIDHITEKKITVKEYIKGLLDALK
jgi:peptide chain release factor 1